MVVVQVKIFGITAPRVLAGPVLREEKVYHLIVGETISSPKMTVDVA